MISWLVLLYFSNKKKKDNHSFKISENLGILIQEFKF